MVKKTDTRTVVLLCALVCISSLTAHAAEIEHWWLQPQRMLQTNLREIDATMDVDQYVQDVKAFGANVVLFNVGGIVANYPTDVGCHYRNPNMKGDLVGTVLARLHQEQVRMIGRFDFSKINEEFAALHPDWLYVSETGQTVNYNGQVHTCVSGEYQQEVMFQILGEAVDRYPLDGVFFNMIGYQRSDYSGNYHGICQCRACSDRFREFAAMELPRTRDDKSPAYRKYLEFTRVMSDRQFHRVNAFLKAKRPDLAICTYTPTGVDVIRMESNSPLGDGTYFDTRRAKWTLLTHPDQQLANASVYFMDIPFRHSAVAPSLVVRRLWQQAVNGAWLDFYCIGPLGRQEDRTGLKVAAEVFQFHALHERFFHASRPAGQVGMVRRGNLEYEGLVNIVSENQVAYDLAEIRDQGLARFDLVIVPDSGGLNREECAVLDRYVDRGGRLLLTGKVPTALGCLSSVEFVQTRDKEKAAYLRIRPEDRSVLHRPGLDQLDLVFLYGPFHVYQTGPSVQGLLRLIPADMFGPPEKCYYRDVSDSPALLSAQHVKGKVASFTFGIGTHYSDQAHQGHAELVLGAIDSLLGLDRRLQVETCPLVEITHRQGDTFEWVGLFNHTGQRDKALHAPVPISDIRMTLKPMRSVGKVRLLKAGLDLEHRTDAEGKVSVTIPYLGAYDMVVFEYAAQEGRIP